MKKIKEVCLICGHDFYHYPSQPRKYCDECMAITTQKTCKHCGAPFTRGPRERMALFIERTLCDECHSTSPTSQATGKEGIIFKTLILGSDDCLRTPPPSDVLDDVIKENCALFRLYSLYLLLLPYDDGNKLEDRLPSTQLYLEDILRRIRNIESAINLSKKVRERVRKPIDKWLTGPTDADLMAIQCEQRSHIAPIIM